MKFMRCFLPVLLACWLLPTEWDLVEGVPHGAYPLALREVFEHVINPEHEREVPQSPLSQPKGATP
jgi:hypothetical protein